MSYEVAQQRMKELLAWHSELESQLERNEATTRLQLIDRLLTECLGWPIREIEAEHHHAGDYADYVLGTPQHRAVLEAKREGVSFTLPAGTSTGVYRLATLREKNPGFSAAVDQALSYAQTRGIPIGSVSNGWQIVAFIATRSDGVPPRDGQCLCFPSLEEMATSFRLLWDNLSKPAVESYAIYSTLVAQSASPPPLKLSAAISSYPGSIGRNSLQQDLQILGEIFIEDVQRLGDSGEESFLRSCYATSGALSQHALVSRQLLESRYSLLFDDSDSPSLTDAVAKSGDVDPDLFRDAAAATVSKRPIILLGDVGVGKTTFIRRLINVDAQAELQRSIVLYINFGEEAAFSDDLAAYTRDAIADQMFEKYSIDISSDSWVRGVYHGELLRFRDSIFGGLAESDPPEFRRREIEFLAGKMANKETHLRACLDHAVKAEKRQVVVFLDNVDQRDLPTQDEIFVAAQTMAASWPATVFVSLRPSTFHKSRRSGSLSAYQPRVFTIPPPRVDVVIEKRLAYAIKKLDDAGGVFDSESSHMSVQAGTLQTYLHVLQDSFKRSGELYEFLDNVSQGNIRDALGFVETFIGSGHVNTTKILKIVEESGSYFVPLHEFVRAVVYGHARDYDPSQSPMGNVFDVVEADVRLHFIVPLILGFLRLRTADGGQDGWTRVASVFDFAQELGFDPSQVAHALFRADEIRAVHFSGLDLEVSVHEREFCRISPLGAYIVTRSVGTFVYLDAVVIDTPIIDDAARVRIGELGTNPRIDQRVERAERFRSYLDSSWSAIQRTDLPFDWNVARFQLNQDLERLQRSQRRMKERRSGLGPRA